jgi:tetratricopeptide (TPR) repeat protein
VRGLPNPIEVYELTGVGMARTRLEAAALRGLTRFVGRDAEVEHLRWALGQAGASWGQVVAIVGEAGVGKSRLVYEFTHSHRVQDQLILEALSVSYGKTTSYLPVIDLLKGYFKIGDRDDHREMRDKVLGQVLGLDRALEPLLPPLLALLDVPVDDPAWQGLDPPQRQQRTLDAVKRLLLRESQVHPLLVVFEDLHWIDGATQALLDSLVESVGSARLLLLVSYRPEYEHHWGSKTAYSQLRLDSLPAASAAELLAALLGPDPGLAPLTQMLVKLVKRGNPFFLEETVRTLVETGALAGERGAYRLTRPMETLQVPATVQTILAARVDRLPPEEKQLLQAASVIGMDVPDALLAAIAEQPEETLRRGLAHLQEAEFLYETRLFPDLEYTFKHALTHEVTYAGLLQERRCGLHARIGEAIETVYRDRLDELVGTLAHHAFRGEQWGKAVTYLRQAGAKAALRSASMEAVERFEQALAAAEHLPRTRTNLEMAIELRFDLRNPLFVLAEFGRALEVLTEVVRLAEDLGEPERVGRACFFMANAHFMTGNLERGFELAERARTIGVETSNLTLQAMTYCHLGQLYYVRGDYAQALSMLAKGDECIEADPSRRRLNVARVYGMVVHCFQAFVLARLGRFPEALESGERCQKIAETTDTPFYRALASWALGSTYLSKGELAGSVALLEASYADCGRADLRAIRPWIATELGLAHLLSSRRGGTPPAEWRRRPGSGA